MGIRCRRYCCCFRREDYWWYFGRKILQTCVAREFDYRMPYELQRTRRADRTGKYFEQSFVLFDH